MKYKVKRDTVEAIYYDGTNIEEVREFVTNHSTRKNVTLTTSQVMMCGKLQARHTLDTGYGKLFLINKQYLVKTIEDQWYKMDKFDFEYDFEPTED